MMAFFLFIITFLVFFALVSPASALDWRIETVDSGGNVGFETSLALNDSGYPRISYRNWAQDHLYYAVKSGGVWITETVDETKNSGGFNSLELDASGHPIISYYDSNVGNLSVAAVIQDNWTRSTVDSGGVGRYSSLALDSTGDPGIAYQNQTGILKYAWKNGSYWTNETVDNSGTVGAYASLALDNAGNPSISYYDAGHTSLRYAVKRGGLWSCTTVDSTGNQGYWTSLDLDASGNPGISYYDWVGRDLRFASISGGVWKKETVDSAGSVGKYTSLALDSAGTPHISYFDETNGRLKYAVKTGPVWTCETVDAGPNVGSYTSLALDRNGNPHISYQDGGNGDLRYAVGIPPIVPDFNASPQDGTTPLNVRFSDISTGGSPSCWNWSFGDGSWFNTSLAAERNPTHVYENPGVFNVTMAVRNFTVVISKTRLDYITVIAPPITTAPTSLPTPLPTFPDPTQTTLPPDPTPSLTPTPTPSPTTEPSSTQTPVPTASQTPESTFSTSPTPLPVAFPDSGSEDPPDMPPVHRDQGPLGCKTENGNGYSEITHVRIIGWDTDCVVTAQQVMLLPDNFSQPKGLIYQYINITQARCPVASGVLEFDVPRSFIEENRATRDDVRLCMIRNMSWICLITKAQGMKNDFVRYHAICPEFSLFAVTLSNETSVQSTEEVFPMQPAVPEYPPANPDIPVPPQTPLPDATGEPVSSIPSLPVAKGIIGLGGLAIATIIRFRTGNRR